MTEMLAFLQELGITCSNDGDPLLAILSTKIRNGGLGLDDPTTTTVSEYSASLQVCATYADSQHCNPDTVMTDACQLLKEQRQLTKTERRSSALSRASQNLQSILAAQYQQPDKDLRLTISYLKLGETNELVRSKPQSLIEVYNEANRTKITGDEEVAYVLFMRCFRIFSLNPKITVDTIPSNRDIVEDCLNQAALLSDSLKQRYEDIGQIYIDAATISLKDDHDTIRADETIFDIDYEDTVSVNESSVEISISCPDLYNIIKPNNDDLLLFDLRPSDDFNESHIVHSHVVNIPAELLQTRVSYKMLTSYVKNGADNELVSIHRFNHIVLFDCVSKVNSISPESGILIAFDALTKYYCGRKLRAYPKILDGGFYDWYLHYPMTLSAPCKNYILDSSITKDNLSQLENVSYLNKKSVLTINVSRSRSPIKHTLKDAQIDNDRYVNKFIIPSTMRDQSPASQETIPSTDANKLTTKSPVANADIKLATKSLNESYHDPAVNRICKLQTPVSTCDVKYPNYELNKSLAKQHPFNNSNTDILSSKLCQINSNQLANKRPYIDRKIKSQHAYARSSNRAGLRNTGNTCFLNSVIQCLCSIDPLIEFFLNDTYLREISSKHVILPKSFASLIREVHKSGELASVVVPGEFKHVICKYRPFFGDGRQHDAMEFLLFLLDGLHEDLNRANPSLNDLQSDDMNADQSWNLYRQHNDSIIVDIFQGMLQSKISCKQCGHSSVKYDVFMYLSLSINEDTKTLQDCLSKFLEPEYLFGESQWMCSKCNCLRDSVKCIGLWSLPAILIIHLKRYDYNLQDKIRSLVSFPVENFVISVQNGQHSSKSHISASYKLIATCNHYGGMDSGHYTAYCRSNLDNSWILYDDNQVRKVPLKSVISSAAYILFYIKC
ncbi:hypothetical protein GJ496_000469 [Pomphorhynchus laevis]|nr:hypothetical protein GJ496_000469 [Pomphorhynchus laevis]